MTNLDKVTGLGFVNLSNIRKLNCRACINLQDNNVIDLLRCASNLELLNIQCCETITNSVMDVAIEVTKRRSNNVVLKMIFYNTSISYDKITDISPLLSF